MGSWKSIDVIVDAWAKGGKALNLVSFVKYVTEVDEEACVWNGNIPNKCTTHKQILHHNKKILEKLNTAIRNKVVTIIGKTGKPSPQDVKDIKEYLNSAPANLRYGKYSKNRSIQNFVDPMGDKNNVLTTKEKSMLYATDPDMTDSSGDIPKKFSALSPK